MWIVVIDRCSSDCNSQAYVIRGCQHPTMTTCISPYLQTDIDLTERRHNLTTRLVKGFWPFSSGRRLKILNLPSLALMALWTFYLLLGHCCFILLIIPITNIPTINKSPRNLRQGAGLIFQRWVCRTQQQKNKTRHTGKNDVSLNWNSMYISES